MAISHAVDSESRAAQMAKLQIWVAVGSIVGNIIAGQSTKVVGYFSIVSNAHICTFLKGKKYRHTKNWNWNFAFRHILCQMWLIRE